MDYEQSETVKVKHYEFRTGKNKTFTRKVWVTETDDGVIPTIELNYQLWKIKKVDDIFCELVKTVQHIY